jgi:hypothetical protein
LRKEPEVRPNAGRDGSERFGCAGSDFVRKGKMGGLEHVPPLFPSCTVGGFKIAGDLVRRVESDHRQFSGMSAAYVHSRNAQGFAVSIVRVDGPLASI